MSDLQGVAQRSRGRVEGFLPKYKHLSEHPSRGITGLFFQKCRILITILQIGFLTVQEISYIVKGTKWECESKSNLSFLAGHSVF